MKFSTELTQESMSATAAAKLLRLLALESNSVGDNESRDYFINAAKVFEAYSSDKIQKRIKRDQVMITKMTPEKAMTKSLDVAAMTHVLHRLTDIEKVRVFNRYDFIDIDTNQWLIISSYFSTVIFARLKLLNPSHLDGKKFSELIYYSFQNRRVSITIEGKCILEDRDIRELISDKSNREIENAIFTNMSTLTALSGAFGGSLTINIVRLVLTRCENLKTINFIGPALKSVLIRQCHQLQTVEINSESLMILRFLQCSGLKSLSVQASNCTLDVSEVGLKSRSSTEWTRFFKKCRVKKIENDIEEVKKQGLWCRIRMFGLSGSGSGTSWLHGRLRGDVTLYGGTTLGTNQDTIKNFYISKERRYKVQLFDHNNNSRFREGDLRKFSSLQISYIYIFSISLRPDELEKCMRDTTYKKSMLLEYEESYNELSNRFKADCYCILTGTMIDLAKNDAQLAAFKEMLEIFSEKHNLYGPVLTSAKNNVGIEDLRNILREVIESYHLRMYEGGMALK